MFVYIMASNTKRLYVGVTNDLVRRVWEHQTGRIPGFTQKYGIKRLVYFETFFAAAEAIRREKQIKSYARVKKVAMVNSSNPEWKDLSGPWFADVTRVDPSLRSG
jgi:putative endonuclease